MLRLSQNTTPNDDALLTVKQLAEKLSVSVDWVYKRTRSDAADPLPFLPLGRRVMFRWSEVEADLNFRRARRGTLSPANEIARVKRKEKTLTRKRFQKGSVRLRTDGSAPRWEGFYREDVRLPDGTVVRPQRSVNLGTKKDVPTKRLAERKLAEKLTPINEPHFRPGMEITLEQFMPKYEALRLVNKKGTTQHGYRVVLSKHIVPAFGHRLLDDITEEDVQYFLNRKALDVGWNTLKNIKWTFSAVFTAAKKFGYARHNPVRGADLPPEPVIEEAPLPSVEQLRSLMDVLDEDTEIMVWVDCITAVRPSELMAFRRSAVDFARKCIWVKAAINQRDLHTPKYHRMKRPIRISDADLERLRAYMAKRPNDPPEAWLFPASRGTGPKEYRNVLRRSIQPKARELGLPNVTWRLLRHWHTTVLQDLGVPVKVAQERLGHSRPETTLKHYTHVTSNKADEAASLISAMFAPTSSVNAERPRT